MEAACREIDKVHSVLSGAVWMKAVVERLRRYGDMPIPLPEARDVGAYWVDDGSEHAVKQLGYEMSTHVVVL